MDYDRDYDIFVVYKDADGTITTLKEFLGEKGDVSYFLSAIETQ